MTTPPLPRVSVIVPLFNSAATIEQTLRSLQRQTLRSWEALVIDDGSTDDGPALALAFAHADPRIRVIRQPNRGLAAARNTGIAHARGDFIHFLDADDAMTPHAFEHLVLAAAPTGASCGAYELADADLRPIGREVPLTLPAIGLDELLVHNRFVPHSVLLRRDLLTAIRFRSYAPGVEDYDLWLQLASAGVRWSAIDLVVATYRIRPGSMSKDFSAMLDGHARVLARAFQEASRSSPSPAHSLPQAPARLDDARRAGALTYATMTALTDPDQDATAAARLYRPCAGSVPIAPSSLAATAASAIPFALGLDPSPSTSSVHIWLPRVAAWWARCTTERWAEPGTTELALAHLARVLVHPGEIARSILDTLPPATTHIVVLGLDRHARRLIRAAINRRIRVTAVDPCESPLTQVMLEPHDAVHVARNAAPALEAVAAGSPVILIRTVPSHAQSSPAQVHPLELLAARLAATRTLRWTDHQDRLASLNHEAIHAALTPVTPASARA